MIGGVLEILNNSMRNVHVERKRGLSEKGSLNYIRISFDVLSRDTKFILKPYSYNIIKYYNKS